MKRGYLTHIKSEARRHVADMEVMLHAQSKGMGCDRHLSFAEGCRDCETARDEYESAKIKYLKGGK